MSTKSLAEMKDTIKTLKAGTKGVKNSGKSNTEIAEALAGTEFLAENSKGEFVTAVILPNVSPHGKIQARLGCAHPDCTETHDREMSDWHQALLCKTHREQVKVKLTPEQKEARKLAKAKAIVAAAEQAQAQ